MIPKRKFLYVLVFIPLILGTTYVIKEGDVEVGRWTEDDGKNIVEVIENDARLKKKNTVIKESIPTMTSARRSVLTTPEVPNKDEFATWRVAGQVVDTISLKGIPPGGFVVFTYNSTIVKLPIKAEGFFRGEVPQLETGGYYVTVEGVSDQYDSQVELMKSGSFSNIAYEQRLRNLNVVPFSTFEAMIVYQNEFDMEVGLKPKRLSEKDKKAYNELMRRMTSG